MRDGSGAVVGTAAGKVHLPYIAEENHGDNHDVAILMETEGALQNRLKQVMHMEFPWRC